jgi:hypothetical protein
MKPTTLTLGAALLALVACGVADPNGTEGSTAPATKAKPSGGTTVDAGASGAGGAPAAMPSGAGGFPNLGTGGAAGAGGKAGTSGAGGAKPADAGVAALDGGATGSVATIQTVEIPVAAGAELVKCQNFKNPFGKDVALLSHSSDMISSHHMFVFHDPSYNADMNAVEDCSGIEFNDLLHMAQTPHQEITYPAGVGRSVKAGEGLRILVHLLNTSTQPIKARVTVNFNWVLPSAVQTLAVALFLNNALLSVPPGMSTQSRSFTVPNDIKVLVAVSHMHSRATNFISKAGSQVLYQGTDWNEPVVNTFNPPMAVSAGTTITWACTYNNTTGMSLSFGESANTNEMCILAGVAYPAKVGQDLGTSLESVL